MKIITVAVNAPHVNAEKALRESVLAYCPGADYLAHFPAGPMSRREALTFKPPMIRQALSDGADGVLWLDADCVLRAAVTADDFAGLGALCMYSPAWNAWADGVLYVGNTKENRLLMQEWEDALAQDDWTETDTVLSTLIAEMAFVVGALPPEYCWREKWGMRETYGNRPLKIEVTEC